MTKPTLKIFEVCVPAVVGLPITVSGPAAATEEEVNALVADAYEDFAKWAEEEYDPYPDRLDLQDAHIMFHPDCRKHSETRALDADETDEDCDQSQPDLVRDAEGHLQIAPKT